MVDFEWNYSRDLKRNIENWSQIDLYNEIGNHSKPCPREERILLFQEFYKKGIDIPERFQDVF